MKLEQIGFYTLTDARAATVDETTPLQRCELILTDSCNFKCSYCRALRSDVAGTMPPYKARQILMWWIEQGLQNVRFSGGEPTLYQGLDELVEYCRESSVKRIAISSNGSASVDVYRNLIQAGANDFSISLDACCASDGDAMAGGIVGSWSRVVSAIRYLAANVYTTVGIVLNENNLAQASRTIQFAADLGVSDIRVIPAAQYGSNLSDLHVSESVLARYPILRYRIENLHQSKPVRGLSESDSNRCPLTLDDMAVAGDYHFPCIIYLREGGDPIGQVGPAMRTERAIWARNHNCYEDKICRNNCLDVCVAYNNRVRQLQHAR